MGQEVKTEVPRAAEAGLYTEGDKGRLCALVRVHWSVHSMLTQPRGPVSQSSCVSGARAVPCTAVRSNLIVQ
ncbi:hypothetical protein IEO21_10025 [Rhodonia placenta]|uniref:Uncharacterized protein n=1 Tax=Rhodonia placenta TaxID=104341 RepID=A0A8H7TXU2_9APHY|nr:hypothetical protein IEO21_10025 [Postia placenta]